MNIRKKDFQRVVHDLKDFLSKLNGNIDTAELRDSLNFSLLHLHKYYKRLRHKVKSSSLLDGSLSLTSSLGSVSPASPFLPPLNKFEWRWINLDSAHLSASFGHGDHRNLLPEIFYVLKDADVERLRELILKDPDCINEVDALGRSTVFYCLHGKSQEHLECLDLLIERGVDLQQEANDGQSSIHIAVLCDNEEGLDRLIDKKVSVNVEDNDGRYPIHLAAAYSSSRILNKLLDAGADKETLDNDEMTPVMWACYFDHYDNLETLLSISPEDEMRFEIIDAEMQDKDVGGKTLLHWSVSRASNKHCFKVLFNPEYCQITDNLQKTILHTIAESGVTGALEEYLSVCELEDLDVPDGNGRTALHLACMCGHGEIVDVFLNRGASLDIVDKDGKTPVDYAKSRNLNYCLLVILSHIRYRQKVNDTSDVATKKANNVRGETNATTKSKKQENTIPQQKRSSNTLTVPQKTKSAPMSITTARKQPNVNSKNNDTLLQATEDSRNQQQEKKQKSSHYQQQVQQPLQQQQQQQKQQQQQQQQKGNKLKEKDEEYRGRCDSDASQFDTPHFDTPQDHYIDSTNNLGGENNLTTPLNNVKPTELDIDNNLSDGEGYNFNDQMIVLVEHQGSDDELVIGLNESQGEVNIDEDEDLLDVTPFARNGSITTPGVVSDGSVAFNSVSVNPSVSSLSDESDGERDKKDTRNQKRPKTGNRRPSPKIITKKEQPDQQSYPNPQMSVYSPRVSHETPSLTAPTPPPSYYYAQEDQRTHSMDPHNSENQPSHTTRDIQRPPSYNAHGKERQRGGAQVLVLHDDTEEERPALNRNELHDIRPKTSKGRNNSLNNSNIKPKNISSGLISGNNAGNSRNMRNPRSPLEQSWPPSRSKDEKGDNSPATRSSISPSRSSSSVRLAPISPSPVPRQPSHKF